MRLTLAFTAVVALAGCTVAPKTPEVPSVRVVYDLREVQGCTAIRQLAAATGWGPLFAQLGHDNARYDLKAQTARLGGNVLAMVDTASDWQFQQTFFGTAYRCP